MLREHFNATKITNKPQKPNNMPKKLASPTISELNTAPNCYKIKIYKLLNYI